MSHDIDCFCCTLWLYGNLSGLFLHSRRKRHRASVAIWWQEQLPIIAMSLCVGLPSHAKVHMLQAVRFGSSDPEGIQGDVCR